MQFDYGVTYNYERIQKNNNSQAQSELDKKIENLIKIGFTKEDIILYICSHNFKEKILIK